MISFPSPILFYKGLERSVDRAQEIPSTRTTTLSDDITSSLKKVGILPVGVYKMVGKTVI